jgi:hypothetical protein
LFLSDIEPSWLRNSFVFLYQKASRRRPGQVVNRSPRTLGLVHRGMRARWRQANDITMRVSKRLILSATAQPLARRIVTIAAASLGG